MAHARRKFIDEQKVTPSKKGKAGIAITYMHRNWDKLIVYTKNGRLNINNNPVENAISPFAIGRKN